MNRASRVNLPAAGLSLGAQMNSEMAGVAERLVDEFGNLPRMVVLETVRSCAGECDKASPFFVEQAARASLSAHRKGVTCPPQPIAPV